MEMAILSLEPAKRRRMLIISWAASLFLTGAGAFLWQQARFETENFRLQQENIRLGKEVSSPGENVVPAIKATPVPAGCDDLKREAADKESVLKGIIYFRAKTTMTALKNRDWELLAKVVHTEKGVRFSPYSYIDAKNDLVFTAAQVRNFGRDEQQYLWGAYDGKGDPIRLTAVKYFATFVYNHDFILAPKVSYNRIIGRGNTTNNQTEAYPGAIIVEYHFPGFESKYEGMDWQSLRLIFEMKDGIAYLVGISHDQWTI
jgi:hypothetical protein